MTSLRAFLTRPATERGLGGFVVYRIRWAIDALVALFFIATIGYVVLEHYTVLDGAFMTVITLSTVGYEVVRPLNAVGKLFTIGVIIAGFMTLAYAGAVLTTLFTSGEIAHHLRKSRFTRMRHGIEGHVIVVGFGRVGQAAAHGVAQFGKTCIVMDRNPDRESVIAEAGFTPMIGDATAEADLIEAGIERAVALVAAAEEDSVNLIVTLTARALRPDLRIVSRVNELTWQDRIVRAGASVAQSPYRSYGMSLAASAVNPAVLEMHAIPILGLVIEEIEVSAASSLIGLRLSELSHLAEGVFVIGLRRESGFQRWNEVDGVIAGGDVLVALGSPDGVDGLSARVIAAGELPAEAVALAHFDSFDSMDGSAGRPLADVEAMEVAIEFGRRAIELGEAGVGAVVLGPDRAPLSARHGAVRETNDPSAHASVLALRDAAAAVGSWRLLDATLVVTLEPCPLCSGAAVAARVARVVIGARDELGGALGSIYNFGSDPRLNHELSISDGVLAERCAGLLGDERGCG